MIKSSGIIRKIDELGRVVLPIELRKNFGIKEKDNLEILIDGEYILLKKHNETCNCCRTIKQSKEF